LTYIALRQSPTDEGPKKISKLYESDSSNLEVRSLFGWYLSKSKKRVSNINEDPEQRHYKHTLQYHDKHDRYALTGMGNVHLLVARDMRRDTDQEKEKRRKMYQRAVEFFDKALQLDPKNAYAAQGVAIALIDDKKDHSGAVQILARVRDTIKDPSVYLNLGHVYGELRQYSRSIEHYEAALAKDRARDVQILACLGRVWQLKAKQEASLQAMKTALEYAQRAQAVSPEALHLQFNVAFVQNQIASLAYSIAPTQKTLQDVEEAAEGLKEAIDTFDRLSKEKNPPYPASALEQRANMGRTIAKQLDRALQSQKEYEEKNATKLREAREVRAAAIAAREEQVRKAQEVEAERKRKIAAERAQMVEEAQRSAAQRTERERVREEAELTEGSDGERTKRKKKPSSKRKKKDDFVAADDEDAGGFGGSDAGASEGEAVPKKKRRLERRSGGKAQSKFKSSEVVVDSDEDEEEGGVVPGSPKDDGDDDDLFGGDGDEDVQEEDAAPRRRGKASRRIEDDDDDEEEEEEVVEKAATASPAPAAAAEGDDDELFGDDMQED
jgi:RNA polymerase-associated protein CTR9